MWHRVSPGKPGRITRERRALWIRSSTPELQGRVAQAGFGQSARSAPSAPASGRPAARSRRSLAVATTRFMPGAFRRPVTLVPQEGAKGVVQAGIRRGAPDQPNPGGVGGREQRHATGRSGRGVGQTHAPRPGRDLHRRPGPLSQSKTRNPGFRPPRRHRRPERVRRRCPAATRASPRSRGRGPVSVSSQMVRRIGSVIARRIAAPSSGLSCAPSSAPSSGPSCAPSSGLSCLDGSRPERSRLALKPRPAPVSAISRISSHATAPTHSAFNSSIGGRVKAFWFSGHSGVIRAMLTANDICSPLSVERQSSHCSIVQSMH